MLSFQEALQKGFSHVVDEKDTMSVIPDFNSGKLHVSEPGYWSFSFQSGSPVKCSTCQGRGQFVSQSVNAWVKCQDCDGQGWKEQVDEYELCFEPLLFDNQYYVALYRNKDLMTEKVVIKPGYVKKDSK